MNDYPTRPLRVLRVDASARRDGSISRRLTDQLIAGFQERGSRIDVTQRDLATTDLPYLDADWIAANFTPPEQRNSAQRATLLLSDQLVQELVEADLLVIGVPLYNFSIPAKLKAWVDLVARAGLTFRYTDAGPQGLLKGKRAFLLLASGGVRADSAADFATAYLRHVLGFLGISEVTLIAADGLMQRGEAALESAHQRIEAEAAQLRGIFLQEAPAA
ncbi:MAG: NAD(P)H-dependent oxidoreductase [Thiohalobacteraceae bacterium]